MALKFELMLQTVECVNSTEKESDELYIVVTLKQGANTVSTKRFPAEGPKNYWAFKNGQKQTLNLTIAEINDPKTDYTIEIDFREDDTHGLSAVPLLGGIFTKLTDSAQNNEIGTLNIVLNQAGEVKWQAAKRSVVDIPDRQGEFAFELVGGSAEYKVVLACHKTEA
jgi:hypothetical protein